MSASAQPSLARASQGLIEGLSHPTKALACQIVALRIAGHQGRFAQASCTQEQLLLSRTRTPAPSPAKYPVVAYDEPPLTHNARPNQCTHSSIHSQPARAHSQIECLASERRPQRLRPRRPDSAVASAAASKVLVRTLCPAAVHMYRVLISTKGYRQDADRFASPRSDLTQVRPRRRRRRPQAPVR